MSGPNPERYARLAERVPATEAAARAEAFLDDLEALREEHGIPELVLVGCVFVTSPPEAEADTAHVFCGRWGSVRIAAQLGKYAYEAWTAPEVARLRDLEVTK